MAFNLLKKQSAYQSSAKVVDGSLILSLPDAQTPIVWRMELGSVKASAMEIRSEQNDPYFHLVLKTAKGETQKIAPYETRDQALHALMAVSKALETAQPQNQNDRSGETKKSKFSILKWIGFILIGLVILFLVSSWISFSSRVAAVQTDDTMMPAPTSQQPNDPSGIAVPADTLLQGF